MEGAYGSSLSVGCTRPGSARRVACFLRGAPARVTCHVCARLRVALAFVITRHRSPPSHSPRGAATRNTNSQHTTDQDADQSYNINECTQHPDSTSHRLHLYGVKHAVRSALPFDSEARRTLQSRSKRFHPAHPSRHRSSPRGAPKTREGERSAAGRLAALSPTHVPHSGRALQCPAGDQKNFWRTPRVEACLAANVAAAAIAPSPAAHPAATFGPEVALYSIPVRAAPPAGLSRSSSPRML